MKTPPGPHAMTAQAGAVGWIVRRKDGAGGPIFTSNAADLPPWLADPRYEAAPLYPTPPAAVPVEALEGLAAEWEAEAAALLGKSKRAANHVAAGGLNTRAAQLRKLIKERSNG